MVKRKMQIKINEYIDTNLTHDVWHDQFVQWLESRNESLGTKGEIKAFISSRKKSIFTEKFQKIIQEAVKKGKYIASEDPVLIEHRRKIRKILGRSY